MKENLSVCGGCVGETKKSNTRNNGEINMICISWCRQLLWSRCYAGFILVTLSKDSVFNLGYEAVLRSLDGTGLCYFKWCLN